MFPFTKLTDGIVDIRPFEFGEENELYAAVHESHGATQPVDVVGD
jgi:hypothetical protein